MTIVPPIDLRPQNRRRSKRISARIPIRIRFQDGTKHSVTEETHTLVVNDHGALVLLKAAVKVQQMINVENLRSGEELLCRIANLGPSIMGKMQVAVEFIMPMPRFWKTAPNSKTLKSGHDFKK